MRSPESPRTTRRRPVEEEVRDWVVGFGESVQGLVGGKGAGLGRLVSAGLRVPRGFIVTTAAFDEVVEQALPGVTSLEELRDHLATMPLPVHLIDEIGRWLSGVGGPVAVRSSAVQEDGNESSWAGQHATFLGVGTEPEGRLAEVVDAVRKVWVEAFSAQALHYGPRLGVDIEPVAMAVVVQEMVAPEVAGVVFGRDPVTGRGEEAIVCSARGLGTAVVGGEACDTYYVARPSGYVTKSDLHDETLDGEEIRELVKWLDRAERSFGEPLDVEFALTEGEFAFLQARPITGVERKPESVWTNSNVGEALPGVATPLTWSIIRRFSRRGFERAFGALGLDVPEEAELVGSFSGRVYLNLTEFAEITSHIPLLTPDTLFEMAGGGGVELVRHIYDERDVRGFLMKLPLTAGRIILTQATMPTFAPLWDTVFRAWCSAFFDRDLARLKHEELHEELDRLDAMFDWNGEVMLACASNFLMSYVVTGELYRTFGRSSARGREQELLRGLEVSSADPGLELMELGRIARRSMRLRRLILETDPSETLDALRAANEHEDVELFLTEFERFRAEFGHRAPREADLSTPRWREEPRFLFQVLRGFLDADHLPSKLDVERERQRAREEVREISERAFTPGLRQLFRAVLGFTRGNARRRETMRNRVVDSLDMYRHFFLEVGERMVRRGDLSSAADVFYLTVDEVRDWIDDAGVGRQYRLRVLVRRSVATTFAERSELPTIFVLRGTEIIGQEQWATPLTNDASTRELRGLPASAGRVTGRARVLTDPNVDATLEPGEVLVVPYADVGWTPLFLNASAIVMDLGGPLSHAAIVAREYGVPCVVNARGAIASIRDGDIVTVDGERGSIFIAESDRT